MTIDMEFLTGIIGDREDAEDIAQTIIEAHAETINGLKAEIETYKAKAEETQAAAEQLEALKTGFDYRGEYEKLRAENDSMRESAKKEVIFKEKSGVFRDCLSRAGVPYKFHDVIVKASKDYIEALEADSGKVRNLDDVLAHIKREWGDFIPKRK